MESESEKELLASVVRATKNYVGNDPLLPWLQGVKKMKELLSPEIASQKLPRFLEKCTQSFLNDKRYRNDLRYLQLWIQLLEYVPNPNRGEVLSVMERSKIGVKHALYYQAYALHYEKLKKYSQAEAMYKMGIQRLAEPAESLQQSYDSFLQRLAHRNRRKLKPRQAGTMLPSEDINSKGSQHNEFVSHIELGIKGGGNESESHPKGASTVIYSVKSTADGQTCDKSVVRNGDLFSKGNRLSVDDGQSIKGKVNIEGKSNIRRFGTVINSAPGLVSNSSSQDTVSLKKNLESGGVQIDATRCYGNGNPTKYIKKANAGINQIDESMKKNPLRGINGSKPAVENFYILPDESLKDQALNEQLSIEGNNSTVLDDNKSGDLASAEENDSYVPSDNRSELVPVKGFEVLADDSIKSSQEQTCKDKSAASILVEDFQELSQIEDRDQNKDCGAPEQIKHHKTLGEGSDFIAILPSRTCTEDTVIICKFVDSTIVGDTNEVEDSYHHGLIEPTVITKEVMSDINDMFGKPLNFEKSKSVNQLQKMQTHKQLVKNIQALDDKDLKELGSVQRCLVSKTSERETPIVPLAKDFKVLVDENLIYNSYSEANSSKNLVPVEGLQIFDDDIFKVGQNMSFVQSNTGKDQGFSSVPLGFFHKGVAVSEKTCNSKGNSSKGKNSPRQKGHIEEISMHSKSCSEDTIVIRKFVDSAIIGDSRAFEAASHHGLVDPTVNTKAAMEEINSMFLKPLQFDKPRNRKRPPRAETTKQPVENFQIFVDEDLQEQGLKQRHIGRSAQKTHSSCLAYTKDLDVFVDGKLINDSVKGLTGTLNPSGVPMPLQELQLSLDESSQRMQKTLNKSKKFENKEPLFPQLEVFQDGQFSPIVNLSAKSPNEDTIIIRKIVDSAIVDTEVEDACHHGLVDPTINTKEAMSEINAMFCKSLPFDNTKRSCRQPKDGTMKQPLKGSWIFAGQDTEDQSLNQGHPLSSTSEKHDSSVPLVNNFQIFVDENVDGEYTNKQTKKSCLSGGTSAYVLSNESSPDMRQKPYIPCNNSEDEAVCMPTGCFNVFIDEQFQL